MIGADTYSGSSPPLAAHSGFRAQAKPSPWVFLMAALALLGAIIGWNLYSEYQGIETSESERLVSQAKVINENLGRQLIATHLAMESIRRDLPSLSAQGRDPVTRRLQAMREAMPGIRALTVFDAAGTLTARSPDQFVGQNFRDREYFQIALKAGNPSMLYVSPPFLAATGEYVINMVKILPDAQGNFGGILLASLDPSYFTVLLDSIRYAPDMLVSLAHHDGQLFLVVPASPDIVGKDLSQPDTLFTRHLASGRAVSLMSARAYVTGTERMVAWHTIQPDAVPMDKPLVLAVSRDVASLFRTWRRDAEIQGGLFALISLISVAAMAHFQQRRRAYDHLLRMREGERRKTEAQLRIAATAFESREGMMITDSRGVILIVNKAFVDSTGYAAHEIIGQTPRILRSGRHDAAFYRAMWDAILSKGGWQGEIWDRRKNGEIYPKWLTISAVKDEQGVTSHYIGTHYDITERKRAEEKIRELAFFDQLTGLPNRTLLQDRLKQAIAASSRSGFFGALLFIDLDNFKTLNDTLGHDVGDQLLKQVARRLNGIVRDGDTVARLGGDEFVIVLPGLDTAQDSAAGIVEMIGGKVLAALHEPYRLGDALHHGTASIGVTLFSGDAISLDELMKQADMAMYQSKEAGRNRIRFFDPALEAAVKERAALEDDLRQAVEQDQLLLHFQPQITRDGTLSGAEALVRWRHPERGMVSPADFIPLAEESGLILPVGQWVLENACRQLASWADQPATAALSIAVNISARQFRQDDLIEGIKDTLARTGANPARLKLELTESILVDNVQDVIAKMLALKAVGVGFSLDDFGTGYSSLSYLKQLPLDQLKIDQSFVRDVLVDPNDASIARTIIALGQNLGLSVIAEGVETSAQHDFLAASGCQAYQGYFFSRPLPLDDFEAFARKA